MLSQHSSTISDINRSPASTANAGLQRQATMRTIQPAKPGSVDFEGRKLPSMDDCKRYTGDSTAHTSLLPRRLMPHAPRPQAPTPRRPDAPRPMNLGPSAHRTCHNTSTPQYTKRWYNAQRARTTPTPTPPRTPTPTSTSTRTPTPTPSDAEKVTFLFNEILYMSGRIDKNQELDFDREQEQVRSHHSPNLLTLLTLLDHKTLTTPLPHYPPSPLPIDLPPSAIDS